MANIMKLTITVAIGLFTAPLAAHEQQFDLICDYGVSERASGEETRRSQAQPNHLQIDLAQGRWCEGNCGSSSISNVVSLEEGEIVLTDKAGVGFEGSPIEFRYYDKLTYNRVTGVLIKTSESDVREFSRTTETTHCKEQAFSGLTWSEFKPPHMKNQGRFVRDLNDGEQGRPLKKLAFPGSLH